MFVSCFSFAESEGFKPPIPERGIPDFESSAFGHSANFPFASAKVIKYFVNRKKYPRFFETIQMTTWLICCVVVPLQSFVWKGG